MSLDNVHIPMRANRILSIAQINGKLEIAILGEEFFETDSYFEDLHDAVLPFDNIRDLKRIIDHIINIQQSIQRKNSMLDPRHLLIVKV